MSTAVKPVRKFPPPCWTRDEALVLIEAYRERWYALHRAFLRNPDWDAVAEKVTTSCPDVMPPKTSAQCRHKMEKLRQRHRTEKQRASSFPGGRFFSSWFYYEAMEAMENGPNYEPGNNNQEIINNTHVSDLNPGRGIRFKPSPNVQNQLTLAASPNFDHKVSNHTNNSNSNSLYMKNWGTSNTNSNQEENEETEDGYFVDPTISNKSFKNPNYPSGVRITPVILEPVARKFSKVVNHDHEVDEDGQMWVKVPRNHNGNNQNENSWNPNQGNERKKRGNGGSDGIHEVVSSIKLLGDGFMKMEKMKIDMAREIERMRIETEMKRNQLILDSQKQIIDAFVKGLIENRKQTKLETVADS
uniref:trihelix transcription factor ASIL2-like n=1 Tax=Erigeron canadensis TaxID=72917 RepID=UPI001CB91841|nr:trihelix transcription factor ASIL2-like [Erigeron canadensis]